MPRETILDLAASQIGYRSDEDNWNKYADEVPRLRYFQNRPWGQIFISWLAYRKGLTRVIPVTSCSQRCAAWFRQQRRFDRSPRPGDLMVHTIDGEEQTDLVVAVGRAGRDLITIGRDPQHSQVSHKTFRDWAAHPHIQGFCHPLYPADASPQGLWRWRADRALTQSAAALAGAAALLVHYARAVLYPDLSPSRNGHKEILQLPSATADRPKDSADDGSDMAPQASLTKQRTARWHACFPGVAMTGSFRRLHRQFAELLDFRPGPAPETHEAQQAAPRALVSTPSPPEAAPQVSTGTDLRATYSVQPGDSLPSIAQTHNVPGGWVALYEANRSRIGPDPGILYTGTPLVLPGSPGA
ncbi:hypothetical protein AB0H73_39355 [Streptomyces olivoreticuli]